MAIITIEDLLANKKKLEEKKNRTIKIEIEELGGEIEIKIPTITETMETLDKTISSLEQADEIIYYNIVNPQLNNENLLTSLKCMSNPVKVVEKVMSEDVRMKISVIVIQEAMGKTGIVQIADDIKN